MKTSSSEGRETLTERIGWPSSANRRGTNCSPVGHAERDCPLGDSRLDPEALAQRGDRRLVVVGLDLHAVLADARLQRLGRVEHDDRALVHDRDAVAVLGLVHVVGGEEDRDVLVALELAM